MLIASFVKLYETFCGLVAGHSVVYTRKLTLTITQPIRIVQLIYHVSYSSSMQVHDQLIFVKRVTCVRMYVSVLRRCMYNLCACCQSYTSMKVVPKWHAWMLPNSYVYILYNGFCCKRIFADQTIFLSQEMSAALNDVLRMYN